MIAAGLCDAAIVGGADSLCLTTLYGFHSLSLNAPGPCRPFDARRDGISIGEAAGFALLERPRHNAGDVLLLGVGESNDAYHMSSPHPEGAGSRLAMERALASAGLRAGGHRLHQLARHRDAGRRHRRGRRRASALFGDTPPQGSTKGHTGPHARRRGDRRGDHFGIGDPRINWCRAVRIPKRSTRRFAGVINLPASRRGSIA